MCILNYITTLYCLLLQHMDYWNACRASTSSKERHFDDVRERLENGDNDPNYACKVQLIMYPYNYSYRLHAVYYRHQGSLC